MYTFDEKEHIHFLDEKPLHGVTSILSVISKPALIQWAANMACDFASGMIESNKAYSEEELAAIFKEARYAHSKKKKKAGDWGTVVHKKIELWIKEKKVYTTDDVIGILLAEGVKDPKLSEEEKEIVDVVFVKFQAWVKENGVEFIESEKHVWSQELWVGGIVDLVFTMDGKKYIGDIKTSSGIYNEAFFQMGAYNLCLEEMGEHKDIEGYIVINLKKDGQIDFKLAENMTINKDAFKHALGLHKIINSLN